MRRRSGPPSRPTAGRRIGRCWPIRRFAPSPTMPSSTSRSCLGIPRATCRSAQRCGNGSKVSMRRTSASAARSPTTTSSSVCSFMPMSTSTNTGNCFSRSRTTAPSARTSSRRWIRIRSICGSASWPTSTRPRREPSRRAWDARISTSTCSASSHLATVPTCGSRSTPCGATGKAVLGASSVF